jgi:hypothetical protein
MRLGEPIDENELEGGPAEEGDIREEGGWEAEERPAHPDTPCQHMWRVDGGGLVDGGVEGARSSSSQTGVDARVEVEISS